MEHEKIWNSVYLGLGFLLFGLGAAGTVMPVLRRLFFGGGSVFLCKGIDTFSSVVCWDKPLQTLYRAGGEV